MNLRSLFRRKAPPVSAPPPPPAADTGDSPPKKRRRWRRWVLILGTVTVLGLTRNQWPVLMETARNIDFAAWTATGLQDRWDGMWNALRPDFPTMGEVQGDAAEGEVTTQRAADDSAAAAPTAVQATPTATPTPEPPATPTPVPWRIGTTVYATATTEFTYLWMEPGTAVPNLIAERYEAGAAFQIIEPGRGYLGYPVELDGTEWWRLQAEDGLVGWIEKAQLTTEPLMRG